MRVRPDSVFIAALLHTAALLFFIRPALWHYFAGRDESLLARLGAGFQAEARMSHYLGVTCLAIILIGLIVVWTGYVRRSRSAWFVMFVLVWFWAFPLFILPDGVPLVRGTSAFPFPELLYNAMLGPGFPRTIVELILIFSLAVIALVLPIRRFFGKRQVEEPIHLPSAKVVGLSLIGALAMLIALRVWLGVGVLYEIPLPSSALIGGPVPPPPPPPNPCKCVDRD